MMIEPGSAAGPYIVDKLLGEGSVGRVYRVVDDDGRPFAMKVLLHRGQDARARFRQEAEVLLALEHPNVARGVALVEVEGGPALVMEYVDGVQLDHWLTAHPSATLSQRDQLARQLVEAVGFAHGRGLIHRDLKPSNLLVEERPGGPRLVVTDFGLAKRPKVLSDTRTGITLGSPRYVAPEQARDAKRVDHRADIWSIGVVLYELYIGRPAFDQSTMLEVLGAVTQGRFRDPGSFGVPSRVHDAILGAMQVEPAARFPNCRALAVTLGLAGSDLAPALGSPVLPTTLLTGSDQPNLLTGSPTLRPLPLSPIEQDEGNAWVWAAVLLLVVAWLFASGLAAVAVVLASTVIR